MKLCTAVQEGRGYKGTLRAHRYFAALAKYFTVCITYLPPLVTQKYLEPYKNSSYHVYIYIYIYIYIFAVALRPNAGHGLLILEGF